MRSIAMPSRSHQTESLERLNEAIGAGEGHAVVGADGQRQAALAEQPLEGGEGRVFAGRFEGFAQQQEARGVVGDGQRIAVAPVAELELALEVGAPQIVGRSAVGERRAARAVARPRRARLTRPWRSSTAWIVLLAGTRTSPASRRTRSSRILRAPQCGFSRLSRTIRPSTCWRQLVGVAHRPPRAIGQRLEPVLLVAIEDLVAGLARDAELPADIASSLSPSSRRATNRRRSSITEHSFHGIDTSRQKGEKCYPCVRYDLSPMSRVAHLSDVICP